MSFCLYAPLPLRPSASTPPPVHRRRAAWPVPGPSDRCLIRAAAAIGHSWVVCTLWWVSCSRMVCTVCGGVSCSRTMVCTQCSRTMVYTQRGGGVLCSRMLYSRALWGLVLSNHPTACNPPPLRARGSRPPVREHKTPPLRASAKRVTGGRDPI